MTYHVFHLHDRFDLCDLLVAEIRIDFFIGDGVFAFGHIADGFGLFLPFFGLG